MRLCQPIQTFPLVINLAFPTKFLFGLNHPEYRSNRRELIEGLVKVIKRHQLPLGSALLGQRRIGTEHLNLADAGREGEGIGA